MAKSFKFGDTVRLQPETFTPDVLEALFGQVNLCPNLPSLFGGKRISYPAFWQRFLVAAEAQLLEHLECTPDFYHNFPESRAIMTYYKKQLTYASFVPNNPERFDSNGAIWPRLRSVKVIISYSEFVFTFDFFVQRCPSLVSSEFHEDGGLRYKGGEWMTDFAYFQDEYNSNS